MRKQGSNIECTFKSLADSEWQRNLNIDMSVEHASTLLWQLGTLPKTGFTPFKLEILKELASLNNIAVGCTGKRGGSLKVDYLKAIIDFVSRTIAHATLTN